MADRPVPPLHRPAAVLDELGKLTEWWSRSVYAPITAETFQTNDIGQTIVLPLDRYLGGRLAQSEPVFVTSQIVDRLWKFARQYESREPLTADDIPCRYGFAWLESPGYVQDVRGRICSIRAMSWAVETDCLFLAYYSDRLDPLDEVTAVMREHSDRVVEPRLPLLGWSSFQWNATIRDSEVDQICHESDQYQPAVDDGSLPTVDNMAVAAVDALTLHRFWLALFEFMGQQVSATASPDRAARRRVERTTVKARDVKVVDLRATLHPNRADPHNPGTVAWTHRWKSRGHKRRYYNKVTGELLRVGLVAESVKGPKHLPLVEKDTVLRVKR